MAAKRRRRGARPPAPRSRPLTSAIQSRPTGRPDDVTDAMIDKAVRAMATRDGWSVESMVRQSVQRRGKDRSVVFRLKLTRSGTSRPATFVGHVSDRRPPGGIQPVLVGGHRIYVWRYPRDPFLPGLVRVTSNARIRELFDEFGVGPGEPQLTRRVYRPTRRGVIQADLHVDGAVRETVWVKVLGEREQDRIVHRTRQLADHHRILAEHLPVPGLVGVVPEDGILATANVPGDTLRRAILDAGPVPEPADVAALAISLAAIPLESDANPPRYADPTRHAATIGEILPEQHERARRIVRASQIDGPPVTVHGDFHDGQVLVGEGRVTGLIDIDGVGSGLLAHDAGRIIAYVESIADIDRADPAVVDAYVEGLRSAFADHVDQETLVRATAAAWLALATGPHRRQQKDWREATIRRLDHAERWLDGLGLY